MSRIDRADLDFVLERAADDIATFAGARILVTGGTGFVGKWLLESIVAANQRLGTRASVTLLTRRPDEFRRAFAHLANDPAITLQRGDVVTYAPDRETFDAVFHAATTASTEFNDNYPDLMLQTIVDGTRAVLAGAARAGRIPVLVASSGAVYGRQPPELPHLDEEYRGGPDQLDIRNAYHEGKRCAELLCAIAARAGLPVKIARMFAFVGPHLPIDRHFALGNFIRDALGGGPIVINGDGTPLRSYLYAADMTVWLWRIWARAGTARPYNVGSEDALSIADIARAVARATGPTIGVEVRGIPVSGRAADRYVPSTTRARRDLDLQTWTSFDDAIRRTIAWHRRAAE